MNSCLGEHVSEQPLVALVFPGWSLVKIPFPLGSALFGPESALFGPESALFGPESALFGLHSRFCWPGRGDG